MESGSTHPPATSLAHCDGSDGDAQTPAPTPTPIRGAFSRTQYTLLDHLLNLGEDGYRQASKHIMDVYAQPLRVYFLGSSFARQLGDADDVVRGFFADRLSRRTFLDSWKASGRRLRFWLITAFKHYLYEQRHGKNRKDHQPQPLDTAANQQLEDGDQSPEEAFHREVALSVVHLAFERARESCEESGHAAHWEAMIRHHLDGRTFEELSREYGVNASRLRVMARTAGNRFRRCLREELAWPGAHPDDVDHEICMLMEVLKK